LGLVLDRDEKADRNFVHASFLNWRGLMGTHG
jgi:hypothetical protein